MYCKNCKKEVENTLELYDGSFACAQCKTKIEVGALTIDAANEEKFVLSEIMFHHSLLQKDNKAKRRENVNKALELCKVAAFRGHPKAVVRLAYYYEMGYVKMDAVQAFKMACQYYRTVWSNDFTDAALKQFANLRHVAATRHLNLLEHTPPQLRFDVEHYGYEKVSREMVSAHAIQSAPRKPDGDVINETDEAARITDTLNACLNAKRAPLFGIIALTGAALRNWAYGEVVVGKKRVKRYELYSDVKDVELYLLWSAKTHYRHVVGEHSFAQKDNTGNLLQDDETYYLCFLNGKLKKFVAAKKLLEPSGDDRNALFKLVKKATRNGYADYVFYADDVLFHRSKGETIKHATMDLINAVCEAN